MTVLSLSSLKHSCSPLCMMCCGLGVIDTDNYYPERDGHIPELDNESTTTSELLPAHLATSKVVKAFNHIYAAALTTDGQLAGCRQPQPCVSKWRRLPDCRASLALRITAPFERYLPAAV